MFKSLSKSLFSQTVVMSPVNSRKLPLFSFFLGKRIAVEVEKL